MKIGKLYKVAFLAVGAWVYGNVTQTSAALIDVAFNPGGSAAQTGAAVLGSAGDIWNNLTAHTGVAVVLNNTSGAPTAVTLTYAENFGKDDSSGSAMDPGTTNLMSEFGGFDGQTLALSGLAPNTAYTLALYGAGDQNSLNGASNGGQGTTFTIPQGINPAVVGLTTEVDPSNPSLGDRKLSDGPGVAYVLLNANSNAGGNMNLNITYNSTSFSTSPVNGLQIEPVSVPEPASLGVLGLVGIALLGSRRRRPTMA